MKQQNQTNDKQPENNIVMPWLILDDIEWNIREQKGLIKVSQSLFDNIPYLSLSHKEMLELGFVSILSSLEKNSTEAGERVSKVTEKLKSLNSISNLKDSDVWSILDDIEWNIYDKKGLTKAILFICDNLSDETREESIGIGFLAVLNSLDNKIGEAEEILSKTITELKSLNSTTNPSTNLNGSKKNGK